MKVKDTHTRYKDMPSASVMRGRLLKAIEDEEDTNFIQNMYVMMLGMKKYTQINKSAKYSLSELKGILAPANEISYTDIREEYLKEKYML